MLNEEIIFSEIQECYECPFENNQEICSNHPDGYHPCEFKGDFEGMTTDEVESYIIGKHMEYEDYLDRQDERAQQLKEKAEQATAKRRQTNWENKDLNDEIKRLNKAIKYRKNIMNYSRAFKVVDNMMNNKHINDTQEKHPVELEIDNMLERIEQIKQEKKQRAKERRKNK